MGFRGHKSSSTAKQDENDLKVGLAAVFIFYKVRGFSSPSGNVKKQKLAAACSQRDRRVTRSICGSGTSSTHTSIYFLTFICGRVYNVSIFVRGATHASVLAANSPPQQQLRLVVLL